MELDRVPSFVSERTTKLVATRRTLQKGYISKGNAFLDHEGVPLPVYFAIDGAIAIIMLIKGSETPQCIVCIVCILSLQAR